MGKFNVYVDWTKEAAPRAYYVGKGTEERVKNPWRGEKHERVRNACGWERVTVMETDDEQKAMDKEQELIRVLRTSEGELGCNVLTVQNGGRIELGMPKAIHLKLPASVHAGLKLYAAQHHTTMQALLELHATHLARQAGKQEPDKKPATLERAVRNNRKRTKAGTRVDKDSFVPDR